MSTRLGDLLPLLVSLFDLPKLCEVMLASSASKPLHSYNTESEVFFRYCHGLLLNHWCQMHSFQFSYPHCLIVVTGILLSDLFSKHSCFFLGCVRLLDTLIAVPQQSVHFGGICGEEFVDGTSFILAIAIAKAKPLHKKGIKTDCTDCRPISILSNLGKTFEKNHKQSNYQSFREWGFTKSSAIWVLGKTKARPSHL